MLKKAPWNTALSFSVVMLFACADQQAYKHAFSEKSALKGSIRSVSAAPDKTLRVAKQALVKQGFSIENVDSASGLIKAIHNLRDPEDDKVSYNITATVDVNPGDSDNTSNVALSAHQQTILHREWHTWWHLLWIVPLFPTGTEYQTVVVKEGQITDAAFYNDFFSSVEKGLPKLVEKTASSEPMADSSISQPTESAPEHLVPATVPDVN